MRTSTDGFRLDWGLTHALSVDSSELFSMSTSAPLNGRPALSGSGFRSNKRLDGGGAVGSKSGPRKKMTIKPFKVTPKLPESFEQETWQRLEAAIRAVHRKETTQFSREELYRSVEDMCTWKMAAK